MREYFLVLGEGGGAPSSLRLHLGTRIGLVQSFLQSMSATNTCGKGMPFGLLATMENCSGGDIVGWFGPGFLLGCHQLL